MPIRLCSLSLSLSAAEHVALGAGWSIHMLRIDILPALALCYTLQTVIVVPDRY